MMLPYSKCGLTKLVNKVLNMPMSIYSKDRLISPRFPSAFLISVISFCKLLVCILLLPFRVSNASNDDS